MERTRRSVLSAVAAVGAGGVAGCTETPGATGSVVGPLDTGYAAFFTLRDWAERIGGDRVSFETPVAAGRMGHGWEPGGDVVRNIAAADAFVYLDTLEFAWAQDVAATLAADYDDVLVVDGMQGLGPNLLGPDAHDLDDGHGTVHDHEAEHRDGGEDEHHDGGSSHEHGTPEADAHDHATVVDPHVWVDPVLGAGIVDTVASELAEADPGGEEAYRENAADYRGELEGLDEQYRELVAEAERTVGVIAGHDSFRYVEDRYGFDLHSPAGVSPDASPSQDDIADTIELVDDEGIDTILYDPFESPQGTVPSLAETIVENSTATGTAPITSAEGTTREWQERGWGYVEQIEEITIPGLRQALGAT